MLNINAEEFVPLNVKLEDDMFDKLEREYVENNDWLFEDNFKEDKRMMEIDLGKYYYGIKNEEQEEIQKENFQLKLHTIKEEITYADMVKYK